MDAIKLAIEGSGALEASNELLQLNDLNAEIEPKSEKERAVDPATIINIVSIAVSSTAIAVQIIDWYKTWQNGKNQKTIDKAVLVGKNGQRVLLKNATAQQISEVLNSLDN